MPHPVTPIPVRTHVRPGTWARGQLTTRRKIGESTRRRRTVILTLALAEGERFTLELRPTAAIRLIGQIADHLEETP